MLSIAQPAMAEEWPSLFRGMTVGEGQPGVTVVFVKEDAFAVGAGVHAGDHIVAVEERTINSLDDFAAISRELAGKRTEVDIAILRGGTRFAATLSLASATVRNTWGLQFMPDYSLRFADPKAARRYWSRRAADELVANKDIEAMKSLLNVLHYAPEAFDEALALCETVQRQGERLWRQGKRQEALGVFQQAVALYRQAAAKPLSMEQWARLKRGLQQLTTTLQHRQQSAANARTG